MLDQFPPHTVPNTTVAVFWHSQSNYNCHHRLSYSPLTRRGRTNREMRALALPHIFRQVRVECPYTSRLKMDRILSNVDLFAQHCKTVILELGLPSEHYDFAEFVDECPGGCSDADISIFLQKCCDQVTTLILDGRLDQGHYPLTVGVFGNCLPVLSRLQLTISSLFGIGVLESFLKKATAHTLDMDVAGNRQFQKRVTEVLFTSTNLVELTYRYGRLDPVSYDAAKLQALRRLTLNRPCGHYSQLATFIRKLKGLTYLALDIDIGSQYIGLTGDPDTAQISIEHDCLEHLTFAWYNYLETSSFTFTFDCPSLRRVDLWWNPAHLPELAALIDRSRWAERSGLIIRLSPNRWPQGTEEWSAGERARIHTLASHTRVNLVLCNDGRVRSSW